MIRMALILAALLCAGCASIANRITDEMVAPIPADCWRKLQRELLDSPDGLHRAITREGEARLLQAGMENMPRAGEPETSSELLLDLLAHTRDQALRPDQEFTALQGVVSGTQIQAQPFAAALAGFLTQPDFGCREPLYGNYFQRRYAGGKGEPCSGPVPFAVLGRYDGATNVWLDPRRVSSIHILFAGKSPSPASRFGHLALRLVICPEGKSSSAECDANLSEHLVLGFQAHVDDLFLNTFKALNGNYKSYLFANRFMDVYQEYTMGEFRELYSLPLSLDMAQREALVRDLADIHWRFAGSYNFFTRNCATLLQDALRVSWPAYAASDEMKSGFLRPDSLFETLKTTTLAESGRLESLEVAEREGYYFSSTREFYQRALTEVRAGMQAPGFSNIEEYLQIDPAKRRENRATDLQFLVRLRADEHLREAQIMLEEYAMLRGERLLMLEGAKYFEEQDFLAKSDSILSQLDAEHAKVFDDCLLSPFRQHANPIRRLSGIPTKADIPTIPNPASTCQSKKNHQLLYEAIEGIRDAQSDQWEKLKAASRYISESLTNLKLLKDM